MKKPKLIKREVISVQVSAGGKAFPSAHALYREFYADGSERTVNGCSVYPMVTTGMLNGTKKDKKYELEACRPDLFPVIEAAAILNKTLIDACVILDEKRGCGEVELR
jgi:hypothetical protein